LRVERAFMALNPPMPRSVTQASVPPAIMASASPRSIILEASPMEWLPVAQAVTAEEFGPFVPNLMEICPEARLMMSMGMKKGVRRLGPRSSTVL
jgi:hypothetical protein